MSTPAYFQHTQCRLCQSSNLTCVLDLGQQYVSDFVEKENIYTGVRAPIVLERCNDCSLVQQEYTTRQEFLYTRHYWYHSGQNQTMKAALEDIVASVQDRIRLISGDVVLDIGSNDGTLLRYYPSWITKIGVEPANNLWEKGRIGITHLVDDFWSYRSFQNSVVKRFGFGIQAKVITAIGMFYDTDDPNQFIGDVAKVLAPEGIFVCQLMCLKQMIEKGDVGNLAHEHLLFFTLASLVKLFRDHGLSIFDIEENEVNGGSYRIYVCHKAMREQYRTSERDSHIIEASSREYDIAGAGTWCTFTDRINTNRRAVQTLVKRMVGEGKKVYVYGASTKGNVLLQWYGLDYTYIQGAADKSKEKWGRYTAGTGIPIMSEEEARLENPDAFLILPYGFVDEFTRRERDFLERGGKFIVPLPEVRVIGKETLS